MYVADDVRIFSLMCLSATQQRLHLTAIGVGKQQHFGRKSGFGALSPCLNRRQVSHTVSGVDGLWTMCSMKKN